MIHSPVSLTQAMAASSHNGTPTADYTIVTPTDFLEAEELVLEKLLGEDVRYYQEMIRNYVDDDLFFAEKQSFVDKALQLKRDIEKLERDVKRLEASNARHIQQDKDFKVAMKKYCGWEKN
ncbi:hypothetical protein CJU90_6003 [Yarrowia sp. C11]|nr:hypothetical protein CJU90_6003 [Yarrowia sp. C11]KAG5370720.1 hypothetical protein CKK34_0844 [Yarrowia sp. E02]